MKVPGVHTLACAELGTRPSSVMRRPWRKAYQLDRRAPPPRGTPGVHADARLPRPPAQLGMLGWLLLGIAQVCASALAGALFLAATL